MEIFTLGHSTRQFEEFVNLLKFYKIETVVDVRHFPHSKKFPWFNKEFLEQNLAKNEMKYVWIEKLGGFRESGYKEYMKEEEWREGIRQLLEIASKNKTVVMCAEVLWWKCHRRYISNWLVDNGWEVFHIFDEKRIEKHSLTEHKDTKVKCDRQLNNLSCFTD